MAVEIRVERRRVLIRRMWVASGGIGLPDLQLGIWNRLSAAIGDPATQINDLTERTHGAARE